MIRMRVEDIKLVVDILAIGLRPKPDRKYG